MIRPCVLLAAALVLAAGCGDVAERPAQAGGEPPPVSAPADTGSFAETGGTSRATVSTEPSSPPPDLRPPPVYLESEAARQKAVQGSYCVQKTDATGNGTGVCSDSIVQHPKRLTVVRFGDALTISIPGGEFVEDPEGCVPGCPPAVTVTPLGCPGPAIETIPLDADGARWSVYLSPGAYELAVFGHFEAPDGASGDTSAVLGILVDPQGVPGIVKATPELFVCPPSEQS